MRTYSSLILGIAGLVACGSNTSTANDSGTPDAMNDSSTPPVDASPDAHAGRDASGTEAGPEAGPPSTTIAAARKAMVTTPITVNAFVTALAGVPKDYPNWYIEDPSGGEYSGVNVYCDPLGSTVCGVPEPALHDLIQVKGTLTTFKGQVELIPTAMTVLMHDATFPPIMALSASELAPSANSPYRGVFVKLTIGSELLVDDVSPAALFDTECGTPPSTDGGVEAGTPDAGLPKCSPLCEPPVYSGFRANDGTGNEVYIEAPFFHTDPLQSSPECLTQSGVVAVTVGTAFSKMQGVLDIDPYAKAQALSPVVTTDYGLAK